MNCAHCNRMRASDISIIDPSLTKRKTYRSSEKCPSFVRGKAQFFDQRNFRKSSINFSVFAGVSTMGECWAPSIIATLAPGRRSNYFACSGGYDGVEAAGDNKQRGRMNSM